MDEILDEPSSGRPVGAGDVSATTRRICAFSSDPIWIPDVPLDLDNKRWTPSAVSEDGAQLLYVCLVDEIPRFARERLRIAARIGIRPSVALNLAALFRPELVELLVEVEAKVLVLDDYVENRQLEPRAVLLALAEIEVPVAPTLRQFIATTALGRLHGGTAQEKGKKLEELLAFTFAQVSDLKVVEHNYRNETEEIDLVIQIDNFSGRAWQKSGVPFILVEAKNRLEKASQAVVSALITKLQTKRGSSRIAILVSLAGFTQDAKVQELRFSTSEICVVMIDGTQLGELLLATDMDEALEALVRRALLR